MPDPNRVAVSNLAPIARPIGALLLPLFIAWAGPAEAHPNNLGAREFEAKKACASGHAQIGIDLLAEYYAQTGDPIAIYNQGRCYEQNDMGAQALNRFREYLRIMTALPPDERREVERHIAAIESDVLRRGTAPGQSLPSDEAPLRTERSHWRAAGIVLSVVALAAMGGAVFSSVRVSQLSDDVQIAGRTNPSFDYQTFQAKWAEGNRYETLQWIGYGVAAAAATGALFCLFHARERAPIGSAIGLAPQLGSGIPGGAIRFVF